MMMIAVMMAAGIEAEYGFAENVSITGGVLYSMQGCKFDGDDAKEKLDYINIPILANYYVMKGLAIKAGDFHDASQKLL